MSQPPLCFRRRGVIVCSWVEKSLHKPPHTIFIMTVSSLVHIAPAIEAIETITIWGTKAYAFGSEIFTISAILWCLNFMGNMIQKTFEFGYAFGEFYRKYAHSHLKGFALGVIALAILMGQLTYEGAQFVYTNRNEILEKANNFRNKVGSYFVYA